MPRFFATNRAMHHLGRAVSVGEHGTRHALACGGYNFVDMDEYMRFYLGTTIATEMPTGAIVHDSEQVVFDDLLADDVQLKQDDWLIDNYVMLAPDVERRHVTKCAGGNVEIDIYRRYRGVGHGEGERRPLRTGGQRGWRSRSEGGTQWLRSC